MRDPHDTATLDLVEAARQPLSAAERQRRHRQKRRREREEGRRVDMELTGAELELLACAVSEYGERAKGWMRKASESLWRRLALKRGVEYCEGDPVWSREAVEQEAAEVRSVLELHRGESDRRPVLLTEVERLVLQQALDLYDWFGDTVVTADTRLKLLRRIVPGADWFPTETREGHHIERRHKEQLDKAYRAVQEQHELAGRYGRRVYQAEEEVKRLRARVEGLERENALVVSERTQAFEAVAVLQERLREAGLSDDYRA
ncbi:hypothetical protein [Azotobacter beijerinckii]|uniref:Uncharacterized protein n=1 Tax=Azotobacter beijerinckii TaxID=170623 RepID=A0A1I1BBP1_9GAMM|nr:hypothetical protein [Azotobacter beijerinckii]SFB46128.1 hypothetical protein SAMN04244571_02975 [Azotobacter beijerinckii]